MPSRVRGLHGVITQSKVSFSTSGDHSVISNCQEREQVYFHALLNGKQATSKRNGERI